MQNQQSKCGRLVIVQFIVFGPHRPRKQVKLQGIAKQNQVPPTRAEAQAVSTHRKVVGHQNLQLTQPRQSQRERNLVPVAMFGTHDGSTGHDIQFSDNGEEPHIKVCVSSIPPRVLRIHRHAPTVQTESLTFTKPPKSSCTTKEW
jgi:hypothetical protein